MEQYTIVQNRIAYHSRTTIGDLKLNNEFFCHTLEDTVRGYGIKVKGETAIAASPQLGYKVGIRFSPNFKRDMLILYTASNKVSLNYGGIEFKYIYAHGGNGHINTQGCILVAKNKKDNTIQGSMEKELFDIIAPMIREGVDVRWHIINNKQSQ